MTYHTDLEMRVECVIKCFVLGNHKKDRRGTRVKGNKEGLTHHWQKQGGSLGVWHQQPQKCALVQPAPWSIVRLGQAPKQQEHFEWAWKSELCEALNMKAEYLEFLYCFRCRCMSSLWTAE